MESVASPWPFLEVFGVLLLGVLVWFTVAKCLQRYIRSFGAKDGAFAYMIMQEVNSDPTTTFWGRVNPQTPPLASSQQDWVSYRNDLKRLRDMATVESPAPVVCAIGFSLNPDFRSRSKQLDKERLKEKTGRTKKKV